MYISHSSQEQHATFKTCWTSNVIWRLLFNCVTSNFPSEELGKLVPCGKDLVNQNQKPFGRSWDLLVSSLYRTFCYIFILFALIMFCFPAGWPLQSAQLNSSIKLRHLSNAGHLIDAILHILIKLLHPWIRIYDIAGMTTAHSCSLNYRSRWVYETIRH